MLTYPVAFFNPDIFKSEFSCDFGGTESDYFNRTVTFADRRTWTLSYFAKPDTTNVERTVLSSFGQAYANIMFRVTNTVSYWEFDDPQYDIRLGGSPLATTSWQHCVIAVDTPQGTSTNRVKMWRNGTINTYSEFNTFPVQNLQTRIGSGTTHNIGRSVLSQSRFPFNGHLSEVALVDGTALTPSDFADGSNQPIDPNVSDWGSGGSWMRFIDSGDLGKDYSGNGNDWTANGSLSQSTDVP